MVCRRQAVLTQGVFFCFAAVSKRRGPEVLATPLTR